MLPPQTQRYLDALLADYMAQSGKNQALRLWQAATNVFPEWFKPLMDKAKEDLPGRRVTAEHIDMLHRIMNREGDVITARLLADDTKLLLARDLIDRTAEIDDVLPEELHFEWNSIGDSVYEAALQLGLLPLRRPVSGSPVLLGCCQLCWRTAPRSPYGKFYCHQHYPRPNNSAYKEAKRLTNWMGPTAEPGPSGVYLESRLFDLMRSVPSGMETYDESHILLIQLCAGADIAVESFPKHAIDLDTYWEQLPWTHHFLLKHRNRPKLSDSESVLVALDPLARQRRQLHRLVHQAVLRDQRLLIEMFQRSEAWLSTRAVRRRLHGGKRKKGAQSNSEHPKSEELPGRPQI